MALHEYFNRVAAKPMVLGGYDCVRFVAEALYVGWNRNFIPILDYWDRRSAVRRLRQANGLRDACTDALGDEVHKSELVMGDVAYFEAPHATIGLVMDGYVAVKLRGSIVSVAPSAIITGWKTN